MKSVAVLYATREGQTLRIAEHIAARLRTHGFPVDVLAVARNLSETLDLTRYGATVVAASVHIGKHEREMVEFVKKHRAALERVPSAFFSVSLSEAGAEDASATPERRERASANVNAVTDAFLRETGWKPMRVQPVAGALLYRQYGAIVRLVMRFIARKVGATTDTSRDHEYTDWQALDRLADEFASLVAKEESAG